MCATSFFSSSSCLEKTCFSATIFSGIYLWTASVCGFCHCSPFCLLLLPHCALQVTSPRQQSCPALRAASKERRRNQPKKQITGGKEVNKQPWKTTCTLPLSLCSVLSKWSWCHVKLFAWSHVLVCYIVYFCFFNLVPCSEQSTDENTPSTPKRQRVAGDRSGCVFYFLCQLFVKLWLCGTL